MSTFTRVIVVSLIAFVSAIATAGPAAAHNTECSAGLGYLQGYGGGYFQIGGEVSCRYAPDRISIYCLLDHRHSLYWEGHDSTRTGTSDGIYTSRISIPLGTNGNHYGTVGDKYRTRCTGRAVHGTVSYWNVYSDEKTL